MTMDTDKKLYQVTNGCGKFYVIAASFDEAAGATSQAASSDYLSRLDSA